MVKGEIAFQERNILGYVAQSLGNVEIWRNC